MIDLIHVGDYKTGTSWWQQQVWPFHPDICYIDDPSKYKDIIHYRNTLILARDLDFNADSLREEFAKALGGIDVTRKKRVMCCEALSGNYPTGDHAKRIAERLHAVFGDVKILLVIREQFSMLNAIYNQYVKIGGTLSFKTFVYDPIVSPGLIEKLKYHKIIDVYCNLFGRDNVYIGLFEEFQSNNDVFANRILKFVDANNDWHSLQEKQAVNPSLRRTGLEVQRFANRFLRNDYNPKEPLIPLDRIVSIFLSKGKKQKLLDSTMNRLVYSVPGRDEMAVLRYAINFGVTVHLSKMCERIQFGSKLVIPDHLVETLKDEFVPSNAILRDKYALPVDHFGWFL